MTTGRPATLASRRMSALAVRSRVSDAAAAAPAPMNFLLEICIWLQLVLVDLHGDFPVTGPPAAIHARRVECRGDVSFGVHHDHAPAAVLLDELLHHDIIGRALDRDARISNSGADIGSDVVPDEVLAVTSAGNRAAQVVRVCPRPDDRGIADSSVSLHIGATGRRSGDETSFLIRSNRADGSEMSVRDGGSARFPAVLFRFLDFVRFPASLGPEIVRRDELHSL